MTTSSARPRSIRREPRATHEDDAAPGPVKAATAPPQAAEGAPSRKMIRARASAGDAFSSVMTSRNGAAGRARELIDEPGAALTFNRRLAPLAARSTAAATPPSSIDAT